MATPEDEARRRVDAAEEDEEFHLSKAAEEEVKRLATHPVREVRRLQDEASEGEKAGGLFLLLSEVSLAIWLIAALLIAAVFLIAYFVT
jgi:Flp pilus assembly protein TadB